MAIKVRLEHDGCDVCRTRVTDAETGKPIDGVTSVRFEHRVNEFPTLTLTFETGFDIDAETEADVPEAGRGE